MILRNWTVINQEFSNAIQYCLFHWPLYHTWLGLRPKYIVFFDLTVESDSYDSFWQLKVIWYTSFNPVYRGVSPLVVINSLSTMVNKPKRLTSNSTSKSNSQQTWIPRKYKPKWMNDRRTGTQSNERREWGHSKYACTKENRIQCKNAKLSKPNSGFTPKPYQNQGDGQKKVKAVMHVGRTMKQG